MKGVGSKVGMEVGETKNASIKTMRSLFLYFHPSGTQPIQQPVGPTGATVA